MKFINCSTNTPRVLLLKWLIPVILVIFLVTKPKGATAQTTLSTGDVVFTSYNSDNSGTDTFSIMLLTSITSGTKIQFTDGQWGDANGYFQLTAATSDWIFEWQCTTAMAAFTQIKFWSGSTTLSGTYPTASEGQINFGKALNLVTTGDQIFACQGVSSLDTTTTYRFTPTTVLAGIHANYVVGTTTTANWDHGTTGTSNSELPNSLTNGSTAVWLGNIGGGAGSPAGEYDNARYDCSVTSGTAAAVRAAVNDSTNWVYDDATAYSPAMCTPITSTTWNGGTWSNGSPTSTLDAIIASSTTPGAFTCEDLTINSTFDLTLASGVTATIHGDVTNNGNGTSGTGTLRFAKTGTQALNGTAFSHAGVVEIATGATLTTNSKLTLENGANLMHGTNTPNAGGSISGNVTFEKTIGSGSSGWRMFGSPVAGLINSFEDGLQTNCNNFNPSDRRNVYYWNPAAAGAAPGGGNYATGWTQADSATSTMDSSAYSIYLSDSSDGWLDFNSTVRITGAPNNGTRTYPLQYTFDPAGNGTASNTRGWYMIPNYFPSNLGVYNLINDANFGSTYKAIHIWNQGTKQMVGMNQSSLNTYNNSGTSIFSTLRQISPFTGFWVKATSTSQSIQLKNSMRITRSDSMPANTYFKKDFDVFRMEVKDADGWMDQLSVCFDEKATEGMDYSMDMYKFKSYSADVPTLYTKLADGDILSLSAMPIKTSYSIPVYMESYTNGKQYTVSPIIEEYAGHYDVELVDNKTGIKTDILTTNYKFNHDAAYKNARFTLNFNQKATTSIDELYNQEKMWAFVNENGINTTYQNNNTSALATVEIYNMLGQQLYASAPVSGGQTVTYKPTTNDGANVYIVKIISNGKAKSIKVAY